MTDQERIVQLEARIAQLEHRMAQVELSRQVYGPQPQIPPLTVPQIPPFNPTPPYIVTC